jgi:tetratricopeptide (TPR) repeat protein
VTVSPIWGIVTSVTIEIHRTLGPMPQRRKPRPRTDRSAGPKQWGGVARRGARRVTEEPRPGSASAEWRRAVERARDGDGHTEQWVRVDEEVDDEPGGAPPETQSVVVGLSDEERARLAKAAGRRAGDHEKRLNEAARAFQAERFGDARRILADLAEQAPGVPAIRELHGLTLYRLGKWKLAATELESFRHLTGTTEQHPVLADAYRALGRHDAVEDLWTELREASPSAELVTEGRIVTAGSRSDRGDLDGAIRLLGQGGWRLPRRPQEHHLRRAYALADLHERAGDLPRARDLFERIQRADARFADVGRRLKVL